MRQRQRFEVAVVRSTSVRASMYGLVTVNLKGPPPTTLAAGNRLEVQSALVRAAIDDGCGLATKTHVLVLRETRSSPAPDRCATPASGRTKYSIMPLVSG